MSRKDSGKTQPGRHRRTDQRRVGETRKRPQTASAEARGSLPRRSRDSGLGREGRAQGDLAPAQGPAERAGARRWGGQGRGGGAARSAGPAPPSARGPAGLGPCHVPRKGCSQHEGERRREVCEAA